ncbi:MAG: SDR family oxidoreductase [Halodesulfurarchaeum sp.]
MDLADRTAIVTGASSGIGAATATRLGEAGATVVLAARREDRLEAVADDIQDALVVPTDVTDDDAVDDLIATTNDTYGGFDLLVNNAGIAGGGYLREADREAILDPVEVNLTGTLRTTHAALPTLLDRDVADVVLVSSMNARYAAPAASGYSASKFGVNGFARSLRKELAEEDIRVTIVMPGPVVTELNDWSDWDGRALDPEDVAESIAFTVSRPPHVEIPDITVNSVDKLD